MQEPTFDPASAPQLAALLSLASLANTAEIPLEGGEDPAFGSVRWRTLFSAERTPTKGMVLGIAEFGPMGTLLPHRHGPAEIYFGLTGSGVVTIDGIPHMIGPETALYIPEDAEHGTVAGTDGLRFLYIFPRDSFSEVEYRFSDA
ncbi:cupin domain-containing protein [Salipiger sp. 1_MG-2023]|uniref:cupin domain-containing protein n=1 Tax=Salipiger sp. 1_MG-2023 TaxID=3062665 RepID=UPI0026E1A58C|nr:cupin domain-containing protein [Salipiger sp. 1_MG-2023]MDO6584515.1 cupin domain-containing protein [Salipiger sp. 1_MG-2023]